MLEGLQGRLAVAVAPLVRPLLIVLLQPGVQVHLQFLQSAVELLAKQEAVLLVLKGLVEPFTVAVGLGRSWPWSWSRFLKVSRSLRSHTDRTPPGEMMPPSLRSSLVALCCPKAGNSRLCLPWPAPPPPVPGSWSPTPWGRYRREVPRRLTRRIPCIGRWCPGCNS